MDIWAQIATVNPQQTETFYLRTQIHIMGMAWCRIIKHKNIGHHTTQLRTASLVGLNSQL